MSITKSLDVDMVPRELRLLSVGTIWLIIALGVCDSVGFVSDVHLSHAQFMGLIKVCVSLHIFCLLLTLSLYAVEREGGVQTFDIFEVLLNAGGRHTSTGVKINL